MKNLYQTLCGFISEDAPGSPTPAAVVNQHTNSQGAEVAGVGSRFDMRGDGDGASFRDRAFSHRIQSSLNSNSPNSAYTFALARMNVNFNNAGAIAVAS